MTLENQVVSLDLAKRLKELGFKQDSYFMWVWHKESKNAKIYKDIIINNFHDKCSAYTVAELGEMLPADLRDTSHMTDSGWEYDSDGNAFVSGKLGDKYICRDLMEELNKEAETEADARAKMLIYLKENNLI